MRVAPVEKDANIKMGELLPLDALVSMVASLTLTPENVGLLNVIELPSPSHSTKMSTGYKEI